MQILLALIFGAAFGAAMHYVQAGRDSRGAAVGPMLGAVVGGLTWLVLTWAGIGIDSPWLWLASVAAPAIVVPVVHVVLDRTRTAHDARERERLRIA